MDSETLQTLTVLFTDAVASTEFRSRVGDTAADRVQRAADDVVRRAVAHHNGGVVKTLGDGVVATFVSATSAVSAAELVQQQIAEQGRRDPSLAVALRVGLAAGDVSLHAGDVSGLPVVAAKRLCDLAEPEEVLVTDVVRVLCGSRGIAVFEDLGEREIKGLAAPVAVSRLRWQRLDDPAESGHGVPLPTLLMGVHTGDYVGRADLREVLADELDDALSATTPARCLLLAGEPGLGKTRTAAEVARRAALAGAVVLYGRCDEGMAAAYQPFVEALGAYARAARPPRFGRLRDELGRLVPEIDGSPLASDPRSEEYRLFEAVTDWLTDAAEPQGLVLVLDDLHWADVPTLALLRHVLTRLTATHARVLVLGTYRDADAQASSVLTALLADLRRLPRATRHLLTGLELVDVVAIMERAAGHELDSTGRVLAGTLWSETEGNPFYVGEVLRHLRETGGIRQVDGRWVVSQIGAFEVPDSVREVVARRLDRLSGAARSLLSAASVVGRDFRVDVLAAAAGVDEDAAVDALEEARHARLVEETAADHYRFAHALVRTTLYDGMSATRRRRAHRRVAAAVEALDPADVVALAHHHLAAEPTGPDILVAAGWAVAAGEHALASRAVAEAQVRFAQAAALLAEADPGPDVTLRRAHTLCGLGETQRDQGNPEFRETLLFAGELALQAGDRALVLRAVLGNDRGSTLVASPDPRRVAQVHAALDLVGPAPSGDRALLLTRLVVETTFAGDPDARRELTLEAEAMAREAGDQRVLATVLVRTGMAAHRLNPPARSLARAVECCELADAVGDPVLQAMARSWHSAALIVVGRIRDAQVVTAEMGVIATEASPSTRLFARLTAIKFTAAAGRIARAAEENDDCLAVARALREPDAEVLWGAVGGGLAIATGTAGAFADAAGTLADENPAAPGWRVAHAYFLAEAGRLDDARAVLATHRLDPVRMMEEPFAFQAPFTLGLTARRLGDAALASIVQHLLEPYSDAWAHAYLLIVGPVAWALGCCGLATGDLPMAVARLREAYDATKREGTLALQRLVATDLLDALAQRDTPPDRETADAVRAEVAALPGRGGVPARASRRGLRVVA